MISTNQKFDKKQYFQITVQSLALFSKKLCDLCSFVTAISGNTFEVSKCMEVHNDLTDYQNATVVQNGMSEVETVLDVILLK